jgi:hypothetical protein
MGSDASGTVIFGSHIEHFQLYADNGVWVDGWAKVGFLAGLVTLKAFPIGQSGGWFAGCFT